ncbi:hypothetical protein ODJ79_39705 [Actinoplanes sp. KI2]|uniref:hypothetical protein n=1 Tax=Actinoplanes sp. KI2 TaxID=2983315 RepID=UPI0021D5A5FE|nr:hypothetical protein [Actinoplanes sp. KI2]MCU7729879.1 hypothetical protein [Actinoplanes sp. KI2]
MSTTGREAGTMVRRAITRLWSAAGVVAVAATLTLGAAPAALAAPKAPAKPTSIQIMGKDIPGTLIVEPSDGARLFDTLLGEVNWIATAKPVTTAPKANKLGPKYTLIVLVKSAPQQVYNLYPEATGGPRVHRPAPQPSGGQKPDGWFYGRLTMPETLRLSGVPLQPKPDVINGGIGGVGGGVGENLKVGDADPISGVNDFLGRMRDLLLLNGAVLIVIVSGLAGMAFLIRRRI